MTYATIRFLEGIAVGALLAVGVRWLWDEYKRVVFGGS